MMKTVLLLLLLLSASAQAANEQAETPFTYYCLAPVANKRILPHSPPETLGEAGGKLTLAACRDEYDQLFYQEVAIGARRRS